ncbi:UNVERIFIED_CONTAM: hypothetical protein GTU68_052160 [Idotea baltica]|nr:hypothetical protein [Idotea baltica]
MIKTQLLRSVIAFDYGNKNIGVATGQVITRQAQELCVLKAQNGVPNWTEVQSLIQEWKPDAIIVGLPINMDGSTSDMSSRAEKFSRRIHGRFNLPVYMQDERLTTYEAKLQNTTKNSANYKKNPVDAIAAALLLESWLQENIPDNPTNIMESL